MRFNQSSFFKWYSVGATLLVVCLTGSLALAPKLKENLENEKEQVGLLAIKSMYEFGSTLELDSKMKVLKSVTTPEIFNSLTIDKTERALRVYLKFKENPSSVTVLKSTPTYILYRLNSESIEATRKFIFTYSVNSDGKINYVREGEFVDLSSNP
jgi:hypothetical protein